jgi:RimJ/RimL family protein N-acetyltransferase
VDLRTSSLTLRVPAPEDIDAILAIHTDARACAHNPSDALTSRAEAEDLFHSWLEQWQRHGTGYWTIRATDSGELLGFCGLKFVTLHSRRVLNFFCRLGPQHRGRGVGSEAASAAIQWARSHWPEVPIIARVRPANHASRRLAQRCGLRRATELDTAGEDGIDWLFVSNW